MVEKLSAGADFLQSKEKRGMDMAKYIGKKIGEFAVVLVVVSILIFFVIRLSSVDPVAVILGGKSTSQDIIENTKIKFNLDKPVVEQYILWIKGIFSGDWGIGYKYQQPVLDLLLARLPVTAGLVAGGTLISVIVAIPLGVLCAAKKNTWIDSLTSGISLVLVSVPPFVMSIIMILLLSKYAPSFPITGGYANTAAYFKRIAFPCIALALPRITLLMRVTRSGMVDQMESNYIKAAIAKGLHPVKVVFKHALRNAIMPVLAILSIQVGGMIVGAVLVENIFSLSGVGSLLVDAINASDYPVVQDITLLLVFIFLMTSTVVDLLYGLIDPRVRAK